MSFYRKILFQYKGNREWTKQGYETASAHFNPDDLDVDCTGRHFMITGSNSGIGLETALEVAKRGGVLHMVCRNAEKAKEARSHIITTTGNDKISVYILDLAKPRDVAKWAKEWAETHDKLHVLVHNAGTMIHERLLDEDAIEQNFATNTLSVHILTKTLIPVLQKNEDARVIMVSSGGMFTQKLDPHDLSFIKMKPFSGQMAYSQNKRQQVVMNLCYAQTYDNIHFSCMHPGWADTVAVQTAMPQFYDSMRNVLRTPAQGADTVVWLAVSLAAKKHPSGFFFQDRSPCPTHFPLAWTRSTSAEEEILIKNLDELFAKVAGHRMQPSAEMSGTFIESKTSEKTSSNNNTLSNSSITADQQCFSGTEITPTLENNTSTVNESCTLKEEVVKTDSKTFITENNNHDQIIDVYITENKIENSTPNAGTTNEVLEDSTIKPEATNEVLEDSKIKPETTNEVLEDSTIKPEATNEVLEDSKIKPETTNEVEDSPNKLETGNKPLEDLSVKLETTSQAVENSPILTETTNETSEVENINDSLVETETDTKLGSTNDDSVAEKGEERNAENLETQSPTVASNTEDKISIDDTIDNPADEKPNE